MKRILVIKLSALGDVVQAEGAMHDIYNHHPDDEITVLTTPAYRRFMESCPWVDKVMLDDRDSRFRLDKMFSLKSRLQKEQFDFVYDLQQVGRTNFYYKWFLSHVDWMGGAKGCTFCDVRPDDRCAADHFSSQLESVGLNVRHTKSCDLTWMASDVKHILERHNLADGYTVLIPGASKGHDEKRWPYFHELAEDLLASGLRVVTVPGPDEMELCKNIPGDMLTEDDGRFLDFFKLAGVIKQAGFVIGNDTGPTHIAAHLKVPGLALFNNRIPATFTGIQYGEFSWLQVDNLSTLSLDTVVDTIKTGVSN